MKLRVFLERTDTALGARMMRYGSNPVLLNKLVQVRVKIMEALEFMETETANDSR